MGHPSCQGADGLHLPGLVQFICQMMPFRNINKGNNGSMAEGSNINIQVTFLIFNF